MMLRYGLLLMGMVSSVHAQGPAVTASDWGGIGLLQTPTARMAEAGEVAFTLSKTSPYVRYNFTLQPFDWLEGGFRYIDITNRKFDPDSSISDGKQSLKDKSIDVKFRVVKESRHLPQVAVGLRDLGGTGKFAGEYVVASKRWGPIDASIGLGWGYVGARSDFGNPLNVISDSFNTRQGSESGQGGNVNTGSYFRGPTAVFGGVQVQTPLKPLLIKLEYEGNNYQSEPVENDQEQKSPVNVGLVYRISPSVDLQAAWERGNTAMLSVSLHTNLAKSKPLPRPSEPLPRDIELLAEERPGHSVNWEKVAQDLNNEAGLSVQHMGLRGNELIISAEPTRYRDAEEMMDRASRVLHSEAPPHVEWFTVAQEDHGLRAIDWSVDRKAFVADRLGEPAQGDVFQAAPPSQVSTQTCLIQDYPKLAGGLGVGYQQSVGGPDGFLLYQITLDAEGTWRPRPDLWVSSRASLRVLDNYEEFNFTAPSNLPRVRTFIREYLTTSELTLPVLQINKTWQPARDVYFMAYAGLLESMFGGVGAEWLYRPFGEYWAVGIDVNAVQQRDFEQGFGFRPYRVATGHVSVYADTGVAGIQAKIQAGQYLAGDKGLTLDFSRKFANGVGIGAFATFTNVSKEEFGEGAFDKGIYVNIPFDLMLGSATRSVAKLNWNPLTRDGGARLNRSFTLFDLTQDRDRLLPVSKP
ncbi:MAG: YjbH domain-containing protein [Pseudomonadota bacterium]